MLDMHKLKMKYRELSSNYTEGLMKPVFQTTQRSYAILPDDATSSRKPNETIRGLTPLVNSSHLEANTSDNVSPPNEYLGATASRLKVEIIKEPNSDADKNRGSNMSNKHRMDHKFVPQNQKR